MSREGLESGSAAVRLARVALVCGGVAIASAFFGSEPACDLTAGMVVTTSWLADHLNDPSLVVLHVDDPVRPGPLYRNGHIPGAREVLFGSLITTRAKIGVELPPADSLRKLFESFGVSDSSHVVLTGGPLIVSRTFLTLAYLGVANVSVLDGGTTKWRGEGRRLVTSTPNVRRGRLTLHVHPEVIADFSFVLAHLGQHGIAFVDTRTLNEYLGIGEWAFVPAIGHIPGARRLEWQDFFQNDSDFTLRPCAELQRMLRQRVISGDTVVAYCHIGYRSSATFLVARLLGYSVMLYDGSFEDWTSRHGPTEKDPTPLLDP